MRKNVTTMLIGSSLLMGIYTHASDFVLVPYKPTFKLAPYKKSEKPVVVQNDTIARLDALPQAEQEAIFRNLMSLAVPLIDAKRTVRSTSIINSIKKIVLEAGFVKGVTKHRIRDSFLDRKVEPNLLADMMLYFWALGYNAEVGNIEKFTDFLADTRLTRDRRIELASHEVFFDVDALDTTEWLKAPGFEKLGYWEDGRFSAAFKSLSDEEKVRVISSIFTAITSFKGEHTGAYNEMIKDRLTSMLIDAGYLTSEVADQYWYGRRGRSALVEENLIFVLVDSLFEQEQYEIICDMLQKWVYNIGQKRNLINIDTRITDGFDVDMQKKFKISLSKTGRLSEFLSEKWGDFDMLYTEGKERFRTLDIAE